MVLSLLNYNANTSTIYKMDFYILEFSENNSKFMK